MPLISQQSIPTEITGDRGGLGKEKKRMFGTASEGDVIEN